MLSINKGFEMHRILTVIAVLLVGAMSQSLYCNYEGMADVKIVKQSS